jgi:hypothetical protein
MESGDAVIVARFTSRTEAEAAAERLESEGIESVVILDDGGGTIPALDLTRGAKVMVASENEARARDVLGS